MANIERIANTIATTAGRRIAVEQARCTKVRHRLSRCTACIDACPEQAISIEGNRISLERKACTGCGICIHVCPTEAFQAIEPAREAIDARIDELAAQGHEGELEFSCEHLQSGGLRPCIAAPTLAYFDESHLVHAACAGFSRLFLSTCNAPGCSEATLAVADGALPAARALIEVFGIACVIRLRRAKDSAKPHEHAHSLPGAGQGHAGGVDYSRRGMLDSAATQARELIAQGISSEVQSRLGQERQEPSLSQLLTDRSGNLVSFRMPRQERLLNDLFEFQGAHGAAPGAPIRARSFAQVRVNAEACTGCGMCLKFCPSEALSGSEAPIGSNFLVGSLRDAWDQGQPSAELYFRASDCVACGLCVDVCPLRCLTLESALDPETLFDLEPVDLLAQ